MQEVAFFDHMYIHISLLHNGPQNLLHCWARACGRTLTVVCCLKKSR